MNIKNNFQRQVYIYTGIVPKNTGSGAQVRVFTNICAYADLGYQVDVILFLNNLEPKIPNYLLSLSVKFTIINYVGVKQSNRDRIGYSLGYPKNRVLNWLFPIRKIVRIELQNRIKADNNSIHHFEYLTFASATLGLNGLFIYSNHDLVSDRYLKIEAERGSLLKGKSSILKYYKYFQLRRAEKWIAKSHKLILTVSKHDTDLYSKRIKNGVYRLLPCSWPDERYTKKSEKWVKKNRIKILHLGSLNSMIPYSSLKFILSDLLTILPGEIFNRIELLIAGNNPNAPYSNEIKSLSNGYNNVQILGYVKDLKPLFSSCDIQIVASQFSTGIRTRIIESFVRGLPVVSTNIAAKGLYGLEHRKNILLANDSQEIISIFSNILSGKENLKIIADNARSLYEKKYSRKIQSSSLKDYIKKYIN